MTRILEIARTGYLDGLFGGDVTRFDLTSYENRSSPGISGLGALRNAIRSGEFDLIVCEPNYEAPWHPIAFLRKLFSRRALSGKVSLTRPFGLQMLRGIQSPPIAVVDLEDNASIHVTIGFAVQRGLLTEVREYGRDYQQYRAGTLNQS